MHGYLVRPIFQLCIPRPQLSIQETALSSMALPRWVKVLSCDKPLFIRVSKAWKIKGPLDKTHEDNNLLLNGLKTNLTVHAIVSSGYK